MHLEHLLDGQPGVRHGDWRAHEVTGIAVDSRRVEPGDLFAALAGTQADGTRFLPEALARGAAGLILPAACMPPPGVPALCTPDPRAAVAAAACTLHGHPSDALHVVGVTGSNGKTTVVCMVAQIFAAAGRPAGYWTTNEVFSGARRFRPALTTPEAPDLQRFFREVLDGGMAVACIEVSSHAVVQRRVDGTRFGAGAVTSVTPDHLDFHGSYEAYLAAKSAFLHALPPAAACLVNADDAGAMRAAAGVRARVLTYGFSPTAGLRGLDPETTALGGACAVRLPGAPAPLRLRVPLPGRHNLQNALAALGLAADAGVDADTAAEAIAHFSPPARRMRVRQIGGRTVIDDVAMNAASFDAVCATVAELGYPQVVLAVALRGNRGQEVNARIGAVLAHWNRRLGFAPVIATLSRGALRRYALDYQVRPEEAEAFMRAAREGGLGVEEHGELEEAIAAAVARLRPGGALVLLGTFGMDDGPAIAARLLGAGGDQERFALPTLG